MTTSKAHIISALMTTAIFVQESIEDCLQENSGCFADALPSASLFLKNDWQKGWVNILYVLILSHEYLGL